MATAGSLQLYPDLGIYKNRKCSNNSQNITGLKNPQFCGSSLSSLAFGKSLRTTHKHKIYPVPYKYNSFRCNSFLNPAQSINISTVKNFTVSSLTRSYQSLQQSQYALKLIQAAGIVVFTIWGLGPLIRQIRKLFVHNDGNWKKSATYNIMTSYIQPLLLWTGAILVCRALDPLVLPTEASQAVKTRLINFVKSLSTVLSCAYCLSGTIQEVQKFFMETSGPTDARNMGFQFAGKAVYSAVWVAALSLFMELLGFSTQKWLTAGGLGTVLLTLAGREIFTNFLSSAIIHATRPFVKTEWIQTKIEGYEVSGTVEHVGWWSPTVIRGEDREAVYIPNHKFTVNVVRNLTQKTHWRIKTHLAISHLDVAKINIIVADMRKVLAKSPQVEQQKLHRRVFLDFINPENQALSILVSCFVKTSHFEEYLCVKEAILLDLLRVIRHHRARLATPIRTVQKVFTDADLDDIPHAVDSVFNGGSSVTNRPLLLIEPSYKVNGEDKTTKSTTKSTPPDQSKEESKSRTTKATESKTGKQAKVGPESTRVGSESDSSSASTTITKSSLEENIILGVALEGSKRTLPIEESMALTEKELAPVTGKEKIDNKNNNNNNQNSSSSSSSSTINDQSDQTSYGTEAI